MNPGVERREERIVVRRNDHRGTQESGQTVDVLRRDAPAGNADEQEVRLAVQLGVDEIGASVVVDGDAASAKVDAERAPHSILPSARRPVWRRRHDAGERYASEQDPRMQARYESNLHVADRELSSVPADFDELFGGQSVRSSEGAARWRADELSSRDPRDERRVQQMVEVTMPAEHGVDPPRNPRPNGLLVRLELRRRECRQRCARQIGIDEQRRRRGFNQIARGSEPSQARRSRRRRAERAKVLARLKPRKQGAIKPAHARRVYRSAHG